MDLRFDDEIKISLEGGTTLPGRLTLPQTADTVVLFSHGSGSSRHSPRNAMVAKRLLKDKIGTFLFDLLTPEEDRAYATRFNIDLLTRRLEAATTLLEKFAPTAGCRLGYFGASTGAAAALKAAAGLPQIRAVVSRGGRPDLAMEDLPLCRPPPC